MQIKKTNNISLHKMVDIQMVTQDESKPNTLYIEGYASFYKNDLGIKEVDRDQEIVNVEGMDVSAYSNNPVLLWNHEWDRVCGKVINITKDQNGLLVKAEMQRLTGREDYFENVLYGNVKSFSIGFIPHEYEYLDDAIEITKSEMIELSIAPVQSNRSALFQVIGTKSLAVDNAMLKTLLNIEEKDKLMNLKVKDAEPVVQPVVEPIVVTPVEPAKIETQPVVPEVKVEVKNDINVSELAIQLVKATEEADKIKEEAAKAAEDERLAKIEADKVAEAQKFTDVLTFIEDTKNEILSLKSFDELSDREDELNKIIEPITSASEAIIAKVIELSKAAVEIQPEA